MRYATTIAAAAVAIVATIAPTVADTSAWSIQRADAHRVELAQARDGLDRRVVVINGTRRSLVRLFGSSIDSRIWDDEILRGARIASGQNRTVNFYDGTRECLFDLRAEFSDGSYAERHGYNVCQGTTWTITN